MHLIDKLAWILIHNKTILSTRSYGKDKYYIPGAQPYPELVTYVEQIEKRLGADK